jgi:hypothetical protein
VQTDVWVIFPQSRRPQTAEARRAIRSLCKSRNWDFQERPSLEMIVAPTGRKRTIVSGADAGELYRRLHVARVGVLWFGSVSVCFDPTVKERLREKVLCGLEDFVRHKSFCQNLSVERPTEWLSQFEQWCDAVECEGEHDPRCLPLHVFKANRMRLELALERELFASHYGTGSVRVDAERMEWRLSPRDFHGQGVAQIAGYELRRGFHWDVCPLSGRPTKIMTTTEAWLVYRHINVYPNAYIRNSSDSKKIFPK